MWQAPFRAYGPIVGYDVMFVDGEDSIMITKDRDELFHTVQQRDLPNGGGNVAVQVSLEYSWEGTTSKDTINFEVCMITFFQIFNLNFDLMYTSWIGLQFHCSSPNTMEGIFA